MNIHTILTVVTAMGLGLGPQVHVSACGLAGGQALDHLAQQAVSANPSASAQAISQLRAAGPAGLQTMLDTYASEINRHLTNSPGGPIEEEPSQWSRVKAALDSVSGQCDAYAAKLYWYTDFELAKKAAKARGKPILSLRLLGKLDEEFSCANSRFFRTTLYPNTDVSQYLRTHFILHWQSVRPVPKLTIDFGDGRRLERTITGNSIHYVLDPEGEPIDALPGLYGPQAFLKVLAAAEGAARAYAALAPSQRGEYLRQYHRQCVWAISTELNADLARLSEPANSSTSSVQSVALLSRATPVPTAKMAGRLAFSKSAIESPVLRSIQPKESNPTAPGNAGLSDEVWAKITLLHTEQARLDSSAQRLIRSKNPSAFDASRIATSKRLVESPFLTTLRKLERSIAEDTVRNEFQLHAVIHGWFAEGTAPSDLHSLNARVYADLFLMPESDPWLGLVPANTFTGLQDDGLIEPTK